MSSRKSREMTATEEDTEMYSHGKMSLEELNAVWPERPRNTHRTLPFHVLYQSLFEPLMENKNSNGKKGTRISKLSPHMQRRKVIEVFIARWRNSVGLDFFPAMRLILPEKDRDRAMYGLKEKAIAKLLINILGITPTSDDASALLNWKDPSKNGQGAGDFPERCHQAISKRAEMIEPGGMTIAEVNILLDKLALSQKDEDQRPILQKFYNSMNADEMTWLIRIILRQMKLGASERTVLDIFHPGAEALFNVCSSLRRVCWDLHDPSTNPSEVKATIEIMMSFQPQLAMFQSHNFETTLQKLRCENGKTFWIEEKLDGERMQLHMQEDVDIASGMRFAFYSRKATDYTHLYGEGYEDHEGALTRHLKRAFNPQVKSLILDGEMITWDPIGCKMVPFGTLKSAVNSEKDNPFDQTGNRPLFRVFDCLYLNGNVLTGQSLKNRREILEGVLTNVEQRIEIHEYEEVNTIDAISPALRKVVEEASEGLVLKNPESVYILNERSNDWMKVKPEYMTDFGESLDCVIIGGYYGSGHRGGGLSSFLCGLRVSQDYRNCNPGTNPEKCISFFKVGGGFRAGDYREIKEKLGNLWKKWDVNRPPEEYIMIGDGRKQQAERPDVWVKPSESIVIEVKAASIGPTESFAAGITLRFPRFKKFRPDKKWEDTLCEDGLAILKANAEKSSKKEFKVDGKRRVAKKLKKEVVIAGNDRRLKTKYAGPESQLFKGLLFYVMSDMLKPQKKTKAQIEQMIVANGGSICQSIKRTIKLEGVDDVEERSICVGEKGTFSVNSLIKTGVTDIVRPVWILDAIKQKYLVPFEPSHMYHMTESSEPGIQQSVDVYGDSYTRDLTAAELKVLFENMIYPKNSNFSAQALVAELQERGKGDIFGDLKGFMFRGCVARFYLQDSLDTRIAKYRFLFAGGEIAQEDDAEGLSQFVVGSRDADDTVKALRTKVANLVGRKLPRIVSLEWLTDSWKEGTLLDEGTYVIY